MQLIFKQNNFGYPDEPKTQSLARWRSLVQTPLKRAKISAFQVHLGTWNYSAFDHIWRILWTSILQAQYPCVRQIRKLVWPQRYRLSLNTFGGDPVSGFAHSLGTSPSHLNINLTVQSALNDTCPGFILPSRVLVLLLAQSNQLVIDITQCMHCT